MQSSFATIKEMLSYICNKPLNGIQKFHHYRIVYKFYKNFMQFKWIIIHFLIPLWRMTDVMQDIFIKKLYSPQSNIIMHATTDLRKCMLHSRSNRDRHVLNPKSEDVLLNKRFPRFPLLLGYPKNTQQTQAIICNGCSK